MRRSAVAIVVVLLALGLAACSPSDQEGTNAQAERTREQARQTAEQVKRDSKVALRKLEVDARKASEGINRGLEKTREKVRGALDVPDDHSKTGDDKKAR